MSSRSETARYPQRFSGWWQAPLTPVARRWLWVVGGLTVQAIAVAIVLELAYKTYENSDAIGLASRATFRLILHQFAHNHRDIALLVIVAVLFVAGSVVLARPFTRRRLTLVLAVPLAALGGLVVFGALALLIAALAALAGDLGDIGGGSGGGGSGSNASSLDFLDTNGSGGGARKRKRDDDDDDER